MREARRSRQTRRAAAWVGMAALTAMAAGPSTAAAAPGSVAVTGQTLVFQAGPGTANNVAIGRIFPRPFYWGIQDKGANATIVTGTGCRAATRSAYPFECDPLVPASEINRVRAALGDGDDILSIDVYGGSSPDSRVVVAMFGGPGNDRLTGGPQPDVITGGAGANIAMAGDGADRLQMRNGTRDTLVDCGAGVDTAVVDRADRPIGCEQVLRPR